jgi:hypothetical protein
MALAPFIGPASKAGKAVKATAKIATRTVKGKLKEPRPAEGERGFERRRDFDRMNNDQQRLSEQGQNRVTHNVQRSPNEARNRARYKKDALERGKRFYSDPTKCERFERRVERADVDHRHELQLGGQDIRSNYILRERGANRSVGAQIQGQTKDVPNGTPVDFK